MSTAYITTKDNPYDPAKDFVSWHNYDMERGYFSSELLSRIYEKNLALRKEKEKRFDIDDSEIDEQLLEDSIDEIIDLYSKFGDDLSETSNEKSIEYCKVYSNS